jgi:hypothetical protein
MDLEKLTQTIDQQRWLLNNGLITETVKDQLFFYGSIVHTDVQAVEVKINPEERMVDYKVYLTKKTLKKIETYNKLSTSTSLFGMWRFKRFLKKEGTLNFHGMLNSFVKDFCGPTWSTKLTIMDFDVYVDSIGVEGEPDGSSQPADKQAD